MEKEFFGKFVAKNADRIYKTDCKIVLKEDKIVLNYQSKNGVKSKEYKADCIFSYEDERLIKISERKNTLPEILLSFFGAIALISNVWFGVSVIACAFLRAISKSRKSYILLLNPVQKPMLRLIKCTKSVKESQRKAA